MAEKSSPQMSFSDLGLNQWLCKQCEAMGMTKPTPIQLNCTSEILKGNDCIGCAKTGSGKTAAFALPILQKLCEDPYGIFALVLTPTRELAFQIRQQFSILGKPIGVKVLVITGGRKMITQSRALQDKPHILISTPGRLMDHIESGTNFSLKKIRFLVLDEADRLLEDNFGSQLETIFGALPKKRQTLLFSATMTQSLKELEEIAMNKPFFYQCTDRVKTVEELDQRYALMPADLKDAYLVHILSKYHEEHPKSLVMIFTLTCKYCQILKFICRANGLKVQALHSMMPQHHRLRTLGKFKSHKKRILIATDVASRGLDIPAVDLVINHNIPTQPKNYVHRVGRTARAGKGGQAIALVSQFDVKLVQAVEDHINTKMTEYKVDEKEVMKNATQVAMSKSRAEIKLEEVGFGEIKKSNKRKQLMLEGKNPNMLKRKKPHQDKKEQHKDIKTKKLKKS